MEAERKSGGPAPFIVGLVVVGLLVGVLLLVSRNTKSNGSTAEPPLPRGAAEQAYAAQIHFHDMKMSRAANFLNQEVTFLFGTVSNDGSRAIREIEVTIEFRDSFTQVVLRDTRRLLGARSAAIGPGQRREFQVGFEHVPEEWNRQLPAIRVTGLLFD